MACCAFAAFIIGQCLALVEGWRSRVAAILRLPGLAPAPAARSSRVRPRWKAGLLVVLVLELGVTGGFAIVSGTASPSGILAFCKPAVTVGGK